MSSDSILDFSTALSLFYFIEIGFFVQDRHVNKSIRPSRFEVFVFFVVLLDFNKPDKNEFILLISVFCFRDRHVNTSIRPSLFVRSYCTDCLFIF